MDLFLSNQTNRIDAKGRVSIPAPLRNELTRRATGDLYGLQSLTVPAIEVGGSDLLTLYEERIAREAPGSLAAEDLSLLYYGDGMFLKLDKDGRISINDFIREHTGIGNEVTFVGRGGFFQLWEPGRFREHRQTTRRRILARFQQEAAAADPGGAEPQP